jgi:hypothetical protein
MEKFGPGIDIQNFSPVDLEDQDSARERLTIQTKIGLSVDR